MTARYACRAIAAGLLACGAVAVTVERGQAQAQETAVLPAEGGAITLVGCFTRGGHHNRYVLAKPMANVGSVTEETCTASDSDQMIELKDTGKFHLRKAMVGRWVEITGRLERIESSDEPDDLRELHVRSFRFPPVVVPRAAEVIPPPEAPRAFTPPPAPAAAPAPAPEPAPAAEKPVATTGTAPAPLPKTASPLPLIGSIGLLSLVSGLGVHLFGRRR
jgi:hypothetical protein